MVTFLLIVIYLVIFEYSKEHSNYKTKMMHNSTLHQNINDHFPLSNQKGTDHTAINLPLTRELALKKNPLSPAKLRQIIFRHHEFLASGGAGGKWKTILLKGLVFGIYDGGETRKGKQASFEHTHILSDCPFNDLALPFSNWCGVFADKLNASGIELSHALLTDASLVSADFSRARLSNADFSRADLRGASFREADCAGVDFENCDLRGADFRGARLPNARFPGAKLANVKY